MKARLRTRERNDRYNLLLKQSHHDDVSLTLEDRQFCTEYDDYMDRKRVNTRNRETKTKEMVTNILGKMESLRTESEKEFLEIHIQRKNRKNEMDRIRQRTRRNAPSTT